MTEEHARGTGAGDHDHARGGDHDEGRGGDHDQARGDDHDHAHGGGHDDQMHGGDHDDEDFAEAWEHRDEHDVGADTSSFEVFQGEDTAELLRRQVRDGDLPDEPPDVHARPDEPTGPNAAVIVGVLAVVFLIVAALYLLN